jgi:hypothetical protein
MNIANTLGQDRLVAAAEMHPVDRAFSLVHNAIVEKIAAVEDQIAYLDGVARELKRSRKRFTPKALAAWRRAMVPGVYRKLPPASRPGITKADFRLKSREEPPAPLFDGDMGW